MIGDIAIELSEQAEKKAALKYGGPAFPFEYTNDTRQAQKSFFREGVLIAAGAAEQYAGMTLRDYFASTASEEDIAQYMPCRGGLQGQAITDRLAKSRQQARYMHADDMLAARNK